MEMLNDAGALPPFPALNGAPNGATNLNLPSPFSGSGETSREASILARVTNDLQIASSASSANGEDSSDDQMSFDGPTRSSVPHNKLPTGLCYDARMRFHTEVDPDKADYHPEDPRRIQWIYRFLCEASLVDDPMSPRPLVAQPLHRVPARYATREEVCTVHEESHFEFLKGTAVMSGPELTILGLDQDSVYFSASTYHAALLSAGGAIETSLAVAAGEVKNAIAVIRPPGHHAEAHRSMGFCHFDNVSVAANVVREKHSKIRKVMIVDWDVHHGNGIQQAFESDPNVLYVSIHVHKDGNFYPHGKYGDHLHCGTGPGIGKNINIPWPTQGMGDSDYMFAFQHIIMPVGFDFDPDLVIIAAGFDAANGDQLGGCFVTPACYAHMTHMLMSLAEGKLVVCLEGGYNLSAISKSALAVTKTLMGETPPRIAQRAATQSGVETVQKVIRHQSKYWRCLYPRYQARELEELPGTERMHDVVRAYQSKCLFDSHRMTKLWIYRETISKSFDKQVLATPGWSEGKPLLVLFHDPPEVSATPNPYTGGVELHQATLSDASKHYIAWAIEKGFGVIDVNIPKFLTDVSDVLGNEFDEERKIASSRDDLATYLWTNYVETSDAKNIVLFGIGEAYKAVIRILSSTTWESLRYVRGSVNFVGDSQLCPVSDDHFGQMYSWYYKRSLVFAQKSHPIWDPERTRRPSKKFGNVLQSPVDGVNRMLWEHRGQVEDFVLASANLEAPAVMVVPTVESSLLLAGVNETDMDDVIMVPASTTALVGMS